METIASLAEKFCKKYSKRIAIRDRKAYRTQEITYEELYEKICKCSRLLEKFGIKKGNKIIILGHSSLDYVTILFAAIFQGVIVVPLDIQSNFDLIRKVQQKTKAKIIFTSRNIKLKTKILKFSEIQPLYEKLKPKNPVSSKENDIIEIMFTSGTTGDPKGVKLTNKNFIASITSVRQVIKLPKLKLISVLPLSHILEQVVGLLLPLSYGCNILYANILRPSRLTEIIRNKDINGMVCVPSILESLKQRNAIKNLGLQFFLIGVGGARLDPELEKYWKKRLKIVIQGYGATETTSLIAANRLFRKKIDSVGIRMPGVEIKIIDDEILAKGKNIFQGYYKDAKKTNEALKNGWYKTGDQGYFSGSYLFIKGRKKDMIVTKGGENVYPEDIEKVLNAIKGIKESCVIEDNGRILAYIIPSNKTDLNKVSKEANAKLLPKQRISDCFIWPEPSFPKTPIGKIKKFLVKKKKIKLDKKIFYESKLTQIISGLTSKHPNKNSKLGKDLLLDSLQRVQLISKIEEEMHAEIPEQYITENTTVTQLEKTIEQHKEIQKYRMDKWLLNPIVIFLRRLSQELIILPLLRFFWKVNCRGAENIEKLDEPVIFMSNHQSHFDVFAILTCLPFKLRTKIAVAAAPSVVFGISPEKRYGVRKKVLGFNSKFFFQAYPFGSEIGLERSLTITGEYLDRSYSLIVFPEGHLTRDGEIKKFQQGTGFLALQMETKIIPVRLKGLFELHPVGNFWPKRGSVSVTFGKPVKVKGKSYIQATNKIENMVRSLDKNRD